MMFLSVPFKIDKALLLAIAGFALSGCIGANSSATKFYLLNPIHFDSSIADKRGQKEPISLEIVALRLPQYLERPQIVTRNGENRLDLAEYHQWGGNLRKNMMRALAKNFSEILASPNIAISPNRPAATMDFHVDLEVMQFERGGDGHVLLSVQWRISGGEEKKLLVTRISELTSSDVHAKADFEGTVSSMSKLWGDFSKIIAKEILNQKAVNPVF